MNAETKTGTKIILWIRKNISSNGANLISSLGCLSSTIIGVSGILVALIVGLPGLLSIPEVEKWIRPYREQASNSNLDKNMNTLQNVLKPTPEKMGANKSITNNTVTNTSMAANNTYETPRIQANDIQKGPWRVIADQTIVRKTPSESGQPIATVLYHDGLTVHNCVSISGKWYNITTGNGITGWIDSHAIERDSRYAANKSNNGCN